MEDQGYFNAGKIAVAKETTKVLERECLSLQSASKCQERTRFSSQAPNKRHDNLVFAVRLARSLEYESIIERKGVSNTSDEYDGDSRFLHNPNERHRHMRSVAIGVKSNVLHAALLHRLFRTDDKMPLCCCSRVQPRLVMLGQMPGSNSSVWLIAMMNIHRRKA